MIKEWLNRAGDRGFGFLAALLMRRAVGSLSGVQDAPLREAGLSRAAVTKFLASPLGTEPGVFFAWRQAQRAIAAPEPRNTGQPEARAGPKRRRRRRRSPLRRSSPKSTFNLAKEIP